MTLIDGAAQEPATRESVSVVIPIRSGADGVGRVLEEVLALADEVILVDGRVSDETLAAARRLCPDVRVVLETTRDTGSSLRAGVAAARGDYVVVVDGDGNTDAEDVRRFLAALQAGSRVWSWTG
jgi:glycosyltransferase involved in cell wall biosynthesis